MSELKPCPFCGADAEVTDHENFKIVGCSNLSMLCPNPAMTIYNDDFSYWNSRVQTETENRLTTMATKHVTRADELYEALEMCIEALERSYDATEWPADGSSQQEVTAVQCREVLNRAKIDAVSNSNDD